MKEILCNFSWYECYVEKAKSIVLDEQGYPLLFRAHTRAHYKEKSSEALVFACLHGTPLLEHALFYGISNFALPRICLLPKNYMLISVFQAKPHQRYYQHGDLEQSKHTFYKRNTTSSGEPILVNPDEYEIGRLWDSKVTNKTLYYYETDVTDNRFLGMILVRRENQKIYFSFLDQQAYQKIIKYNAEYEGEVCQDQMHTELLTKLFLEKTENDLILRACS